MNLHAFFTLLLLIAGLLSFGQSKPMGKPKLIVGIVVDQMRSDQLTKYENKLSDGGFKRLVNEGFNFKNTVYNYIPTFTAPGHASIYTGTTPSYHGIIGNAWYHRTDGFVHGVVEDSTHQLVGSQVENPYGVSPLNLATTTITDELALNSNSKAKIISISMKDRGAVLPGGHKANAAYWFDYVTSPGYFVSSTYYMQKVPNWVASFNKMEKPNAYLDTTWNTLLPIENYTESEADNNPYEPNLGGKESPTFPYNFKEMRPKFGEGFGAYQLLLASPGGNTLLTDFALEAIKKEKLGSDDITDFLTISYSVTDVVGHTFGPQSVEIEDIYLRLDKNIEDLIDYLDSKIGRQAYLLFLTSDHGVLPVASFLKDNKMPAGVARTKAYQMALEDHLKTLYGDHKWLLYFEEDQIYLDRALITEKNLDLGQVQQKVADFLMEKEGVKSALTARDLQTQEYSYGMNRLLQSGYYTQRSGDVLITFDSGTVQNDNSWLAVNKVMGTTHGTGYMYDRQVPMLWFGYSIDKGESVREVSPIDIAPSLSMFLDVQLPSGSTGETLQELFKGNQ